MSGSTPITTTTIRVEVRQHHESEGFLDFNEGTFTFASPVEFGRYKNLAVSINRHTVHSYPSLKAEEEEHSFEVYVKECVSQLISNGLYNVIWVHVEANFAGFIPTLMKCGFQLHRTEEKHIILSQWIGKGVSKIPASGTHIGGACGMVLKTTVKSQTRKVLLIREKYRYYRWEFPGGSVDPGDHFVNTACREVEEEVGLRVKAMGFVGCYDETHSRFGKNNVYMCFACEMIQKKSPVKIDQEEILEAKWVALDFLLKADSQTKLNGYPISSTLLFFVRSLYSSNNKSQLLLGQITKTNQDLIYYMAN